MYLLVLTQRVYDSLCCVIRIVDCSLPRYHRNLDQIIQRNKRQKIGVIPNNNHNAKRHVWWLRKIHLKEAIDEENHGQ